MGYSDSDIRFLLTASFWAGVSSSARTPLEQAHGIRMRAVEDALATNDYSALSDADDVVRVAVNGLVSSVPTIPGVLGVVVPPDDIRKFLTELVLSRDPSEAERLLAIGTATRALQNIRDNESNQGSLTLRCALAALANVRGSLGDRLEDVMFMHNAVEHCFRDSDVAGAVVSPAPMLCRDHLIADGTRVRPPARRLRRAPCGELFFKKRTNDVRLRRTQGLRP